MHRQQGSRRLVLTMLLASLALVGTVTGTSANVIVSQSEYVDICKEAGGTPSRVRTNVVKCTNGNVVSTCDFKTKKCKDVVTEHVDDGGQLGGDLTNGEVVAAP